MIPAYSSDKENGKIQKIAEKRFYLLTMKRTACFLCMMILCFSNEPQISLANQISWKVLAWGKFCNFFNWIAILHDVYSACFQVKTVTHFGLPSLIFQFLGGRNLQTPVISLLLETDSGCENRLSTALNTNSRHRFGQPIQPSYRSIFNENTPMVEPWLSVISCVYLIWKCKKY